MPVVLITGATRGIGQAAAIELAKRGAEVAIVGREPARVAETAAQARDAAGPTGAPVHEHVADLQRLDEVRRLADEVLERHPRLDVLANNAGALFADRKTTPDGFEQSFALNHLAPFLLTHLLLDRVGADGGGRVVTTASDAHEQGQLDLDDLQWERRPYRAMRVYGTTKLCNILSPRGRAGRTQGPAVSAACFHPGVVRTGFGKNDNGLWKVLTTLGAPFFRSPERGARSLVWLAVDPEAADLNGVYVEDEKVAQPTAQARDDVLAAGLWERSEALTGIAAPTP